MKLPMPSTMEGSSPASSRAAPTAWSARASTLWPEHLVSGEYPTPTTAAPGPGERRRPAPARKRGTGDGSGDRGRSPSPAASPSRARRKHASVQPSPPPSPTWSTKQASTESPTAGGRPGGTRPSILGPSSSSTTAMEPGTGPSYPGNARCTVMSEYTVPRPETSTSSLGRPAHHGQAGMGGKRWRPQPMQRWTVSRCDRRAAHQGADSSSGTGSGPAGAESEGSGNLSAPGTWAVASLRRRADPPVRPRR